MGEYEKKKEKTKLISLLIKLSSFEDEGEKKGGLAPLIRLIPLVFQRRCIRSPLIASARAMIAFPLSIKRPHEHTHTQELSSYTQEESEGKGEREGDENLMLLFYSLMYNSIATQVGDILGRVTSFQ